MAAMPTGSERQLALYEQTGDLAEVVRRLVGQSRLTQGGDPAVLQARRHFGSIVEGDRRTAPYRFPAHTGAPAV